jgi:hypothetical protein
MPEGPRWERDVDCIVGKYDKKQNDTNDTYEVTNCH